MDDEEGTFPEDGDACAWGRGRLTPPAEAKPAGHSGDLEVRAPRSARVEAEDWLNGSTIWGPLKETGDKGEGAFRYVISKIQGSD